VARWPFDAVPVSFAALVVICVASKESKHENRGDAVPKDRGTYFLDLAMLNQGRESPILGRMWVSGRGVRLRSKSGGLLYS
jgi:hypothetical protein